MQSVVVLITAADDGLVCRTVSSNTHSFLQHWLAHVSCDRGSLYGQPSASTLHGIDTAKAMLAPQLQTMHNEPLRTADLCCSNHELRLVT